MQDITYHDKEATIGGSSTCGLLFKKNNMTDTQFGGRVGESVIKLLWV